MPQASAFSRFKKGLNLEHPKLKRLGFKPETVRHFGAGYCSKGIMRGRVAIPIHNAAGELVAYVGHSVGKQQKPDRYPQDFKYELEVYNLHRALRSRSAKTNGLFLVPCCLDAWRLFECGAENAISLWGRPVTRWQKEVLRKTYGQNNKILLLANQRDALKAFSGLADLFFVRYIRLIKPPARMSVEQLKQALK